MTAFACVFLLNIAAKRNDGLVEIMAVEGLTSRLVKQFRSVPVSKWHLIHLMADGLENVAKTLLNGVGQTNSTMILTRDPPSALSNGSQPSYPMTVPPFGGADIIDPNLFTDFGFGMTSFLNFEGSTDLNFSHESLAFQ